MIQTEYIRFLQTLSTNETAADVRKIANLILQHLDLLIPLSTSKGQRIKKIVNLAQKNWSSVSPDILITQVQAAELSYPITQLKSLSVGPFRGFAKQENFDLASQLVLISFSPAILFSHK